METLIKATHITKTYGNGPESAPVLNDISVTVNEGEFIAVMGPSGSGKTTLMFALSGMDDIDSGSVTFAGRELSALNENESADIRRNEMGFIFQQPTLLKNLNILDNIILPAMRSNKKAGQPLMEKARNLMEETGIDGLEDREITEVSGGQLQRAGICRALMGEPKIIFGDEPTGALNSKSAQEIMLLLKQINRRGTAVLLVTHDAKVAAQTDRVLLMKDGIIADEVHFGGQTEWPDERRIGVLLEKMQELEI